MKRVLKFVINDGFDLEAVVWMCSVKKRLQLYFKKTSTQAFSCEFCEIFKKIFRTPPVAACVGSNDQ